MTIDEQITALIAKAEPLRALPDVEAEAMGLPGIVEQINALRAEQAASPSKYDEFKAEQGEKLATLQVAVEAPQPEKRKPGRPRKADARIEGEDA